MKKLLLFTLLPLLPPVVLVILINFPVFKIAPGSTNTWIAFWGSYLGSLIGAVTVYLVTNMQVKAQRKIQLESIKAENNNAFNREMKQYYFKTQIDKIEEFYELIQEFMDTLMKSANDYTIYLSYNDLLYGGKEINTPQEVKDFEDGIQKIQLETYNWIHKLNRIEFNFDRLALYVEGTFVYIKEMNPMIHNYIMELKEGTQDTYSFKKYIDNPYESPLLIHQDEIAKVISKLSFTLQIELEEKLKEMKSI